MSDNLSDIRSVAVAGGGTMGAGIAQLAAQAGFEVIVYDNSGASLKRAHAAIAAQLQGAVDRGKLAAADMQKALDRVSFTSVIDDLKADFIIEAIIELLQPKQELLLSLAAVNAPGTVLATNTSSIPITRIAAGIPSPERVVGMHFFNPAHIMKLVEIISGAHTAPVVAALAGAMAVKMGKTAVMAKDSPGFIVNRVARHFYVEGLKLLEEGVASHEVIDELVEATGFRMGPFRLMDLIGVETNFSVTRSMFESFHQDAKFRPSRIQQQLAEAGFHGKKSGRGFYDYRDDK